MTVQEIRKAIRNMKDREVVEINGYTIRKNGKSYGVRTDDYMNTPYDVYETQKALIEAIA